MKTSIGLLLTFLIFASCSTSKVIPSQWLSEDFKNQKFDRLLVYANTEDIDLQFEFEDNMAIVLSKKGLFPVKMHDIFPEIEYKEKHSQEKIDQFVLDCKEKNIDKVLIASQKSISVDTVVANSLHNYFNTLESLKLGSDKEENLVYNVKELTTYILEAAVYDIAITSEDKPIATTTLKAINPKSIEKLKKSFLNAISQLFD
ncbi:hypothetical protein [Patiriisocius sp. Uisw_017]|jgi:hypothetical protein|uniref:hypothetical protein n=1 Tax=Patiriisocius sp. Uisw_017 TaxID=3230968 RepID=UPI0039EBDB13